MKRKKRLEAWARKGYDGNGCALSWYRDECDNYGKGDPDMQTVRLVEYDPRAAAVVRAAVDVVAWHNPNGRPRAFTLSEADQRLRRAVERMQKGRKK